MILSEGAKFSKQLINSAFKDPNFTFGFEIEAYVTNPDNIIKRIEKEVKSNISYDKEEQWYHKRLMDISYHDLVAYFVPLQVRDEERYTENHVNESELIISDRLDTVIPGDMDSAQKFDLLRKKQKMYHILTTLKISPKYGFMLPVEQNFKILDAIKAKNVFKIKQLFPNIDEIGVKLFESGEEALEFNISNNAGYRQLFYSILAELIEPIVGGQVVYSDFTKTKKTTNNYQTWSITRDVSLSKEDGVRLVGFELVSPVMDVNTGVRMMKRLFDKMNEKDAFGIPGMGIVTDETTGLHLNIGNKGAEIDYTKMLFLMGDEYIAKKFQREHSDMAALTFKNMQQNIMNNPSLIIDVADELSAKGATNDVVNRFINKIKQYIPVDKLSSVNLEKFLRQDAQFVEFRSVGNTDYHKKFSDIFSVVRQLVTVMYVATEPKIYRNEYYKMIYGVLTNLVRNQTATA